MEVGENVVQREGVRLCVQGDMWMGKQNCVCACVRAVQSHNDLEMEKEMTTSMY